MYVFQKSKENWEAKYTDWYFQTGPAELYNLFASYYIKSSTQTLLKFWIQKSGQ